MSNNLFAPAPLPLDTAALDALLTRHGVTDAGRRLVASVRNGPPARAVGGAGGNVTGRYPSRKMGRTIQYESRTVELAAVVLYETDPDVHEFYDQPVPLSLTYKTKAGGKVRVSHTPDFLVLSDEYAALVECKTDDKLRSLAEGHPFRYVLVGDGEWRCPPGEEAVAPYGLQYRLWTPRDVSSALIDNARFLEAEWGRSKQVFADEVVSRVVDAARAKPGIPLEELVHEVGDPDPVHWAIFHQHVHVDLAAQFLSYTDRVRVFVDEDAFAAWRAAMASVSDVGPALESPEVIARAALAEYPPEALAVAVERYQVLRPAIKAGLPARHLTGKKRRTQGRWLLAYRKAQREVGIGLVGLCPCYHLQGNRGSRFSAEVLALMDEVAGEEYENARNVTALAAHAVLANRCIERGFATPSYNAFLRFLKTRRQTRAEARRKGRKEAEARAPARGPRDPGVVGQGPMDTVHIDHTQLDVLIRYGTAEHQVVEKPWLTLALCHWSRVVVGYALSFDSPAVAGLFSSLRDLYDRQGRLPNRIVVDQGSEFHSQAFEELCAAASIELVRRPPGMPKFGAVVERMFGTANSQFVHLLAGNTQLRKDPRRMSREVDPERDAPWRLLEFDEALRRFLFETYPDSPHRGLADMTPRERFESGLASVGMGRREEPAASDIRFLLWPPAPRGDAKVNGRTGIVVECVRYWHPEMSRPGVRGTRVAVRVDPYDAGHVVAYLGGRWVLCRSERFADFQGYSRRELRLATLVLRERNHGSKSRNPVRAERLASTMRSVRETEEGLRQAQRGEAQRALRARRGLRLVSDSAVRKDADNGPLWPDLDFDNRKPGERL